MPSPPSSESFRTPPGDNGSAASAGADWYTEAEAYDVLCSWDPTEECEFLLAAAAAFGDGPVRRVLEPFCGTGRLLRSLPASLVRAGFDRNAAMARFAGRHGRGAHIWRADARDAAVAPGQFDLAFALVDSFRYLRTRSAAFDHLRSVACALRAGAIYVVGLEFAAVMPGEADDVEVHIWEDSWSASRDDLTVSAEVRGLGDVDPTSCLETIRVRLQIDRNGHPRRVVESFNSVRIWTSRAFTQLVEEEGSFRLAALSTNFGRTYIEPVTQTVVGSAFCVLSRR